ncbi:fimbrillin family protein [Bacteroides sp.]|uniref:fimbrillin family protein n=1 Tax=Bacteroides sp. TaxID=29523 RepID=UPI0025BCA17D|nr:fimbrillin family protein [Bacteroides sp.]
MNIYIQTIIRTGIIALSILIACSCVNSIGEEEKENNSVIPGDIPIKISAKTLHTQIYQKECNEAIGIYVLVAPTTLNKERYVSNKRFSCTTSGFTPDEEIYYPADEVKCNFISYYPYQKSGITEGGNTIDLIVGTDQSSTAGYNNSDFMTAQVSNITSGKKNVELPHTHQLCQLTIRIKPTEGYDINALKKSNPSIRINNVYTQARYDFETKEFSLLNEIQNILPNGEWSIDNGALIGKRSILIPQIIAAGTEILTLSADSKRYECQLAENYELKSSTSCELTILYNPQQGISEIIPDINDWKEGNKSEITPVEKEEKICIPVSDLDFEQSSVYSITCDGKTVAEVCKEYLSTTEIHTQAIVIYPIKNGKSDWTEGTVLQIISDDNAIHGGKVTWHNDNSLSYIPGKQSPIPSFYITSDLSIVFVPPTNPLLLSIRKKILSDVRGSEAIAYPIVKIGTQYWTRENLRTALYNDGKKITLKTAANYSKNSAGYFKESTFIFYNKAAVITGKLAPKGWKIADDRAWQLLKTYIEGDGAVLKGNDLWEKSEFVPSNATGFNAIATGIFTKVKEDDSSIYQFAGKYVAYWNMGTTQKTVAENGVLLRYDTHEIKGAAYSDYCGYSVRCVIE